MRKFISLLVVLFLFGCSNIPSALVKPEIQSAYFSSVSIVNSEGRTVGSGTIILNESGHQMAVITAAHVVRAVQNPKDVEDDFDKNVYIITAYSKIKKKMKVHKINDDKDLALLLGFSKEKSDGPSARLASKRPKIGDKVILIGAPMGARLTVTEGILSNFNNGGKVNLYRIDAAMFFGNSGGGTFNDRNELIGVCNSISAVRIDFSVVFVPGAGFIVALDEVKNFI